MINRDDYSHPVKGVQTLTTEHAAAIVVIGALVALMAIRRGFRGVNLGGVSVGVK
jgi:hypothetical protein